MTYLKYPVHQADVPTMETPRIPEYKSSGNAETVEFQLSLLRVASPGEPPSNQALELESLRDRAILAHEPLQ